jgi:hypothetical protein
MKVIDPLSRKGNVPIQERTSHEGILTKTFPEYVPFRADFLEIR